MELKNDIQLRGTLKSVDQYLNIKLDDISVVEELKYPHLVRGITPQSSPLSAPGEKVQNSRGQSFSDGNDVHVARVL